MRSLALNQISQILHSTSNLPSTQVLGYCVDSRLIKPGDLFFALSGERTDGHQFLQDIQQKGAVAAVVSKDYQSPLSIPYIPVDDPLKALQQLAKTTLANSAARVIAITGSIGKTTTKEFVKTLLANSYSIAASPGNSNSQIGLPLAILNHTTGEEEILILEMGMTHPGQISQLIEIAPPEVAVLTTTALVHACNFHSLEGIVREKAQIFHHPNTRLGVIHRDIPLYAEVAQTGHSLKESFSTTTSDADLILDLQSHAIVERKTNQSLSLASFKLPGRHNLHNLMAAVAVARHFHLTFAEIEARLPYLTLPEKRLQFVKKQEILFLNDSYNAAELSVKAALESIPHPQHTGKKIAVLGSMMELGDFSEVSHQRVGEFALDYVEKVFCLGEECRPIYDVWKKHGKPVELFQHFSDLTDHLKIVLQPHDVVLLKGSRSKELWKVLDAF